MPILHGEKIIQQLGISQQNYQVWKTKYLCNPEATSNEITLSPNPLWASIPRQKNAPVEILNCGSLAGQRSITDS